MKTAGCRGATCSRPSSGGRGLPARGAGGGPRAGARGCLRGPAPRPDAAVAGGAEGQSVKWGDRVRQTGRQVARYPGR